MRKKGFTLIELSIVLVVIGLVVGGVLVGKDLIDAAKLRSFLSQIESYKTASNTFRAKYNGLPGDLKNAAQFGFATRGYTANNTTTGNGNKLIEGETPTVADSAICREGILFWADLYDAGLIGETSSNAADFDAESKCVGSYYSTPADLGLILPEAKAGRPDGQYGVHVVVWSTTEVSPVVLRGNWFNVGGFRLTSPSSGFTLMPGGAFTVNEVRAIDEKLDDGMPYSGTVVPISLLPNYLDQGASPTCIDGGPTPPVYKTDNDNVPDCGVAFKAGF